jgi:hypothetical protein
VNKPPHIEDPLLRETRLRARRVVWIAFGGSSFLLLVLVLILVGSGWWRIAGAAFAFTFAYQFVVKFRREFRPRRR